MTVIIPICVEVNNDNWDTMFLEELGNDQDCEEVAGRDSTMNKILLTKKIPPS